jgi:hypothetical protein
MILGQWRPGPVIFFTWAGRLFFAQNFGFYVFTAAEPGLPMSHKDTGLSGNGMVGKHFFAEHGITLHLGG